MLPWSRLHGLHAIGGVALGRLAAALPPCLALCRLRSRLRLAVTRLRLRRLRSRPLDVAGRLLRPRGARATPQLRKEGGRAGLAEGPSLLACRA
eukprot:2375680-Alexandrium_andersonii.AAC.1